MKIHQSKAVEGPCVYSRTTLLCLVPGCPAEAEYRTCLGTGEEPIVARESPGVLLIKPVDELKMASLVASLPAEASYVRAGILGEHLHPRKPTESVPRSLKNRLHLAVTEAKGNKNVAEMIESVISPLKDVHYLLPLRTFRSTVDGFEKRRKFDPTVAPHAPLGPVETFVDLEPLLDLDFLLDLEPLLDLQPTVPDTQDLVNAPQPKEILRANLMRHGLIYVQSHQCFFCKECEHFLGDVEIHMCRKHKDSVRDLLRQARNFFPHQKLTLDETGPIEPFPLVPITDGFSCSLCHHSNVDEKHVKNHIRTSGHADGQVMRCQVQRPWGPNRRLVMVTARAQEADPPVEPPQNSMLQMQREYYASKSSIVHPDSANTRHPVYESTDLFDEKDTRRFCLIPTASFLKAIFPVDSELEKRLIDSILHILRCPIKARPSVLRQFRRNATPGSPRLKPVNPNTVLKYSKTAMNFLNFLVNFMRDPPEGFNFIPVRASHILQNPSIEIIVDVVIQCVKQISYSPKEELLSLFLRFMAMKEDKSLIRGQEFTQQSSNLLYFLKCAAVCSHEIKVRDDPENCEIFLLAKYYNEGPLFQKHAVGVICDVICQAKIAMGSAPSNEKMLMVEEGESVSYKNEIISVSHLRKAYSSGLSSLKKTLNLLSLGAKMVDLSKVKEETWNDKPGVSLSSLNVGTGELLSNLIGSDPVLKNQWFNSNGTLKRHRALAYLIQHDEAVKTLFMMTHLSSGMPGRITEVETYRVQNNSQAKRTVLLHRDRVLLVTYYSKTNKMQNDFKAIFRYLPEEVSRLLVQFLTVIRPFAEFLCHNVGLSTEQFSRLFASAKSSLTASRLRDIFPEQFLKFGDLKLKISVFRQVIKYVARSNFPPSVSSMLWDHRFSAFDGTALQFGHSDSVAVSHYAVTTDRVFQVDSDLLKPFYKLSVMLQNFLNGLPVEDPKPTTNEFQKAVPQVVLQKVSSTVTSFIFFSGNGRLHRSGFFQVRSLARN